MTSHLLALRCKRVLLPWPVGFVFLNVVAGICGVMLMGRPGRSMDVMNVRASRQVIEA